MSRACLVCGLLLTGCVQDVLSDRTFLGDTASTGGGQDAGPQDTGPQTFTGPVVAGTYSIALDVTCNDLVQYDWAEGLRFVQSQAALGVGSGLLDNTGDLMFGLDGAVSNEGAVDVYGQFAFITNGPSSSLRLKATRQPDGSLVGTATAQETQDGVTVTCNSERPFTATPE